MAGSHRRHLVRRLISKLSFEHIEEGSVRCAVKPFESRWRHYAQLDEDLEVLKHLVDDDGPNICVVDPRWDLFKNRVEQIGVYLGSGAYGLKRWGYLNRHISFGQMGDLRDIVLLDWPSVRSSLDATAYAVDEPIPVGVEDLSTLIADKPKGPIATKLRWERLDADDFQR
jgi:hypothetical protein